jgi:hypothetical protein
MRVQVPPGMKGFRDRRTGRVIDANRQGFITLDDDDARRLKNSHHNGAGLIETTERIAIGTKKGRWCRNCNRLWNAWNTQCSRCGEETVPESEMKQ